MGQYLAIGIATRCSVSKESLEDHNISKKELLTQMEKDCYLDPTIYDLSVANERYTFDLQPKILHQELLPFLEKLYPILYADNGGDFEEVLTTLQKTPPDAWQEAATFESFQVDSYGGGEYLYFDTPRHPCIPISFQRILMLSLEGKISMETYGRHFHFFKYCIQKTFADFSLAKAIRVYITG